MQASGGRFLDGGDSNVLVTHFKNKLQQSQKNRKLRMLYRIERLVL